MQACASLASSLKSLQRAGALPGLQRHASDAASSMGVPPLFRQRPAADHDHVATVSYTFSASVSNASPQTNTLFARTHICLKSTADQPALPVLQTTITEGYQTHIKSAAVILIDGINASALNHRYRSPLTQTLERMQFALLIPNSCWTGRHAQVLASLMGLSELQSLQLCRMLR